MPLATSPPQPLSSTVIVHPPRPFLSGKSSGRQRITDSTQNSSIASLCCLQTYCRRFLSLTPSPSSRPSESAGIRISRANWEDMDLVGDGDGQIEIVQAYHNVQQHILRLLPGRRRSRTS
ncbi:30S ribosomal protein S12 [Striga asiatica]|uniref:30S ribosomal protein S12 n=1 Tax=Striga asiatica TaxID=4170 RepID=A0A5A7Q4V4_STRAF|nr:30S ribosomal protein S12 [Striga asiatica]